MNTAFWILLLLSCQSASASLFGDFYSSMTNLKDSFSTLLTDVIVDVKKTIDCTILVVEQALNIQQLDPDFAQRCKGQLDAAAKPQNDSATTTEINKTEERKQLERDLDESFSRVNESICTMMKHRNLKNMKGVLRNNTDHLFEIKILLRKELDKISDDIKKKFSKDAPSDDDASVDGIYNDLMLLQSVKQMDDNSPEVREIDIVLDDVYDILKINDESTPKSVDGEVNLLKDDEKELQSDSNKLNKLRDTEMKDLQRDTRHIITHTESTTTISERTETPTTMTSSTREVTTKPTTTETTPITTTPCVTHSPTTTFKTTTEKAHTEITECQCSITIPHQTTNAPTSVEPTTAESPKTTLSPLIKGLLKEPNDEDQKAFLAQAKVMMKKKKQAEMMMNMFETGNVSPGTILDLF